jgi:hypothetical protein
VVDGLYLVWSLSRRLRQTVLQHACVATRRTLWEHATKGFEAEDNPSRYDQGYGSKLLRLYFLILIMTSIVRGACEQVYLKTCPTSRSTALRLSRRFPAQRFTYFTCQSQLFLKLSLFFWSCGVNLYHAQNRWKEVPGPFFL